MKLLSIIKEMGFLEIHLNTFKDLVEMMDIEEIKATRKDIKLKMTEVLSVYKPNIDKDPSFRKYTLFLNTLDERINHG